MESGTVERVRAVSATTFYAFGPETLLQSTDSGETWQRRGAGTGNHITGINCASETLCLMSTARGDKLLRSENGGGTAETITASTLPLYAAGFATPTRAVAVGAGGATVVSDDGGRNYGAVGGDIGGSFQFGLRLGPGPDIAFALGARGQLARTSDGGTTWRAINVATSADMQDASFPTADVGYALDVRGGLFRTSNAGQSWQPIEPGTTQAPRAVITSGDAVLLAGPRGVRRATDGGAFDLVDSRAARRADVNRFDRAGGTLFAFGSRTIIRSTDRGRTWRAVRGPGRRVNRRFRAFTLQDVEMTSTTNGYALERNGRMWRTQNGGRTWKALPAVGTDAGRALSFGSATGGYLTLRSYPADPGASYVLRTSDGGKTWRPQRIATGAFPGTEGVISPSATKSYARDVDAGRGRQRVPQPVHDVDRRRRRVGHAADAQRPAAHDHPAPAAARQPPHHGERRAGRRPGRRADRRLGPAGRQHRLERAGRDGRRQRRPLHRGVPGDRQHRDRGPLRGRLGPPGRRLAGPDRSGQDVGEPGANSRPGSSRRREGLGRHLAPQLLERVEVARLGREDVDDHVEVVHEDPLRLLRALHPARQEAVVLLHALVDAVVDRLGLAIGVAAGHEEEVGVVEHAAHIQRDDVCGLDVTGIAGDGFHELFRSHALTFGR